jgi:dienelactone hydrolase
MHDKTPRSATFSSLAACVLTIAACGGAEAPATPETPAGPGMSMAPSSTAPAGAGSGASPMNGTAMNAGSGAKPPAGMAGMTGATTPPPAMAGGTGGTPAAMSGTTTPGTTDPTPSTDPMAAAGSGGAPAAAGSDAPAPSAGGFPRTGEEINVKSVGPYKVAKYEEGLAPTVYASAVMYYPEDATPPFAAVALSPGFTAYGTDYEFVGHLLASHGIAALLTTPTTTGDQPGQRGTDLVAAVKDIQAENTRQGSPLMGKIATDRIGVTGHSMGGGGSLFAANELGTMIRCVMPLQPWQPGGGFPMIAAPTMIVGAASDTIASVGANASGHYRSIPDSVEKFLIVLQGDHYLSTDRTSGIAASMEATANEMYDPQAAYMIPFWKIFLEDDDRYRPYLYGSERSMELVTDYQTSKMM